MTCARYPIKAFREERTEVLHAAIRQLHFGVLVTCGEEGFQTSWLPWMLDAEQDSLGTLVGHLARYNPQCKLPPEGVQAMVALQGPHAYISPSWYPGKREDPRQVPTWDYLVVEARGVLQTFDDDARLYRLLEQLTERNEDGRSEPWRVTDAPADYVRKEMRHIVGIQLRIEGLIGRYKLSQNRNAADQEGVRTALADAASERERALAKAVAHAMRSHS